MSLLALLFAMACERGLTHWLRIREWRWLDPYFDWADRALAGRVGTVVILAALALIALPVLPVLLAAHWLEPRLFGLLQFAFAVFVLLFAFGPRDLKDEVEDYAAALERFDRDEALLRGKELLESSPLPHRLGAREAIEEAIFIQANNRIFGVIFWFMLLGAGGAWLFRISDMLRRRAAFEAARQGVPRMRGDLGSTFANVHGILAWVPARLTALAYALAGSFEDAVGNWRSAVDRVGSPYGVLDRAEDLLARVGTGSLQPSLAAVPPEGLDVATARGAWRIVERSVWIWLAAISLLVITGAAV
jgi:membrane protein required for beta-lactamase induction